MSIIVIGFIIWLIYDYCKDRKIEKELRKIKRSYADRHDKKGVK